MKKKLVFGITSLVIAGGLLLGLTQTALAYGGPGNGAGKGYGGDTVKTDCTGLLCLSTSLDLSSTPLSDAEADSLLYMVEEEKLARDVYARMFDLWGLGMFRNTSSAEQRHIEHVRGVLKALGLSDPTASAKPGEFTDASLQRLYDALVKKGSESMEAALAAGAAIEDIDISDLEALRAKTTNRDISALYDALIAGSENHMRSFAGQLKARSAEYKPEHISPERYASILAGSNGQSECGLGRGQRQGQRNGRGRGFCSNCPHAGN